MNKRFVIRTMVCLLLWLGSIVNSGAAGLKYYNIVDETGQVVYITGWEVKAGDQFLTADNKRYEVVSVGEDYTAWSRYIGSVEMSHYRDDNKPPRMLTALWNAPRAAAEEPAAGSGKVAIYHTHSDESYVPTDGEESILGNGGIYQVGSAFAERLRAQGIEAIHSETRHDPHDDMAYERSRRTAMGLVKQQPDAIFDVHRDAAPPEAYTGTINGEPVTKLQLVVGKYGPTGKQIEDYALQLKAASDQKYPNLIKGIFFAKGGDYNQDLHPRSMLVEAGAHTNDRAAAERGMAMFADIIPGVINKTGANAANQAGAAGFGTQAAGPSGATKAMAWIVGLTVIGGAAFLFLSTGSMREARAKLRQFTKTEFANFLAPHRKKSDSSAGKKKS